MFIAIVILFLLVFVPVIGFSLRDALYHKRMQAQTPEGRCPNCWMKTGYRMPLIEKEDNFYKTNVGTLYEISNGDIICSNHWDAPDYRLVGNRKCLYYKIK
jgi:hypothetical protein